MQRRHTIQSRRLTELASPHLQHVPSWIDRARGSVSKVARQIGRVQARQSALERKLQKARGDKHAKLEDQVMQLEMLLHDLREEKSWWEQYAGLPAAQSPQFKALRQAFERLRTANRIWDVTAENLGAQYRSLATAAIERQPVNLGYRALKHLDPSMKALHFRNANGADVYIFPQIVAVQDDQRGLGLIELTNVHVNYSSTQFFEDETVPPDTDVVGHTWRYTNKDGSRDRRFRENYQIPVVVYGQLDFTSSSGLKERYLISDPAKAEAFERAFTTYQKSASSFPVDHYEQVKVPSREVVERQRLINKRLSELPKQTMSTRGRAVAIAAAIITLIVLAGLYAWQEGALMGQGGSTEEASTQDASTPVPPRIEVTPDRVVGEEGQFALTVIASEDKLSPMRVTVDEDVRRPYWVELGEAVRFQWNDRIMVEGDIPTMQFALEGYEFSVPEEEVDRFELSDSLATSFLRSFRATSD